MQIELTESQIALSRASLAFAEGAMGTAEEARASLDRVLQEENLDVTAREANVGLKAINVPQFVFARMLDSASENQFTQDAEDALVIHEQYLQVILARVEELGHDYEATVREITPEEAFEDTPVEQIAESLRKLHDSRLEAEPSV